MHPLYSQVWPSWVPEEKNPRKEMELGRILRKLTTGNEMFLSPLFLTLRS
jgi:hypothetical protein